jgi:hypothetical protein
MRIASVRLVLSNVPALLRGEDTSCRLESSKRAFHAKRRFSTTWLRKSTIQLIQENRCGLDQSDASRREENPRQAAAPGTGSLMTTHPDVDLRYHFAVDITSGLPTIRELMAARAFLIPSPIPYYAGHTIGCGCHWRKSTAGHVEISCRDRRRALKSEAMP